MKRVHLVVVTCCGLAAWVSATVTIPVQAQPSLRSSDAQRLIGTWRLVSFESSDQEMQQARGDRPIGLLFYDGTGHMAAQIMPDRTRRRFTGPVSGVFAGPRPTTDEALDAITGYTAYFGTYSVDERARTVTHHRLGNLNPGALGDFVRRYEFEADDRLVLVPLDSPNLRSAAITWERVK
jgi:hypothetical protein